MKKLEVYVNDNYYKTINSKEELSELILINNLFECRISIKEVNA
jgi:hypothetical protein